MKAQKLGLVLGINMVAACLVMQGCKATKPGSPAPQPLPTDHDQKGGIITVISSPRPAPVARPQDVPSQSIDTAEPAGQEPRAFVKAQPSVPTVKPLPATPAPKAAKAKPAAAPAASAEPAAASTEYVVKPGDTLFLISKRTNYRQAAIMAANPGLKPDRLRVGQKIKMPGAVAAPAVAKAAAPEAKSAAKDGKVMQAAAPAPAAANTKAPVKTKSGFVAYEGPTKDYTVKSGDSLGKIAMESGISIRALKALNGLQKDNLRMGQKLKVPAEKQAAAKAAAAPQATAKAAADAKPAAVKEAAAPAHSGEAAKPAAQVPAAEAAAPAAEPAPAAEAAASAAAPAEETPALTYTVKDGDDLVSIAIAYGISPSALMDINDLKPTDEIKPGQVLKLPPNAKANGQ